jgi:protein-S-isoprenylcysteine O-methyltransferase Ste14
MGIVPGLSDSCGAKVIGQVNLMYFCGRQDLQLCRGWCIIGHQSEPLWLGEDLNLTGADRLRWLWGSMMTYILLGLCAYPALATFEYASLKKIAGLKQIMAILAIVVPCLSLGGMCLDSRKFSLPACFSWLGWVLAGIFAFAWIYSMFVEIPFAKTYIHSGHGDQLITTGTYALSRHPAVLWFALFLLGLVLATRSTLLLVAAPIWLAADALYVHAEEKLYLERVFPNYGEYQQETPILLPTPRSFRRCLNTVRHHQ